MMKVEEIKEKAADLGIVTSDMSKDDMIRTIQRTEGHTPCFGAAAKNCPYNSCCFRDDCLKTKTLN